MIRLARVRIMFLVQSVCSNHSMIGISCFGEVGVLTLLEHVVSDSAASEHVR